MKLSDYEGEQALDVLADLIEPAMEIMADKEMAGYMRSNQSAKAVKAAIKNHKKAVIEIMAVLDGADPATYKPKIFDLPIKLLEILNDPELMGLFTSQGQNVTEANFGSAMASTEEKEQ